MRLRRKHVPHHVDHQQNIFKIGNPSGEPEPVRVSAKGDRGGPWSPPKKNGVLEVVDDPPWSCDPTVQSIWLAVSKEVEEKGMANSNAHSFENVSVG